MMTGTRQGEGGRTTEAVDMNGRFQMQGGKNWNLPKPVLLGLSLAGNLVKPLLALYGTEWRERGYGLWGRERRVC
jgi:hypothetical protein